MLSGNSQIKMGALLGYLNYGVKMIVQLLYVPIMLRMLGQGEYGVYQLVASLVSYLSLLNFGFSGAYLRFYAQCKNNKEKEAELNGTFLGLFCFFSALALIVGIILTANSDKILGAKLSADELELAKILMAILVVNMVLTFPSSVFTSIITAKEDFVFLRILELAKNIMNPFLTIGLLLIGCGSIGVVAVTTILTVLGAVVSTWFVFFKIKAPFIFGKLNIDLIKDVGAFSFFLFLNSIIDQLNWNVDKYLLGRLVGSVAIAIYSVGAQINNIFIQIADMLSSVLAPRVNEIVATEKKVMEQLNCLFIKVGRLQSYIVMAVLGGFIVFGKEFIRLWAGNGYNEAYYITLLLIVPVSVPLCQTLGVDIQRALNKHQYRSIVYTLVAIGNVIISVPLIKKFGAIGAAAGTTISLLIGNGLIMNIVYEKYIGLDILLFWKRVFPIIAVSLISIIGGFVINHLFVGVSWCVLILKGLMFISMFFLSEYLIAMNGEEKNMVKNVFRLGMRKDKI